MATGGNVKLLIGTTGSLPRSQCGIESNRVDSPRPFLELRIYVGETQKPRSGGLPYREAVQQDSPGSRSAP